MESNQKAADGTVYDNGYGICFIPQTQVTTTATYWNDTNTLTGAYKSSTMHTKHLPGIVTKLQNVLGSHLIQRNVLLSSSVGSDKHSNAYTWTTSYATLMSNGQITGKFASNRNKYDDGEANYKLPIFNYKEYKTGFHFWLRGVYGRSNSVYYVWYVNADGSTINGINVNRTDAFGVRPLIYLR